MPAGSGEIEPLAGELCLPVHQRVTVTAEQLGVKAQAAVVADRAAVTQFF